MAAGLPSKFIAVFEINAQQMETIINQAKRAWLSGDGSAFANLFSTDGEFIAPGKHYRGQDQILQAFQEFMSTTAVTAIEIRNVVAQSNQAVVEWYWEERMRDTGEVSKAEDAIAIDFQGGRIRRWREYIDADSPE